MSAVVPANCEYFIYCLENLFDSCLIFVKTPFACAPARFLPLLEFHVQFRAHEDTLTIVASHDCFQRRGDLFNGGMKDFVFKAYDIIATHFGSDAGDFQFCLNRERLPSDDGTLSDLTDIPFQARDGQIPAKDPDLHDDAGRGGILGRDHSRLTMHF